MMCMCIIYFKSEYIDLSLPFIDLKKVSILIRGLILFTNVNKRQSVITYQLIIVYAHVHLMTHLHGIYITLFIHFFIVCVCMSNHH